MSGFLVMLILNPNRVSVRDVRVLTGTSHDGNAKAA